MDVIVGIVRDGAMLGCIAESVAVVEPRVAAGQTVVTGLLARRRARLRMATRQARRGAVLQGATLLPAVAHVRTPLMVREKYNGEHKKWKC